MKAKRTLAFFLALVLLISCMSIPAFAEATRYYVGDSFVILIEGKLGEAEEEGNVRRIAVDVSSTGDATIDSTKNGTGDDEGFILISATGTKPGTFELYYEKYTKGSWQMGDATKVMIHPVISVGATYSDTAFLAGCTYVDTKDGNDQVNNVTNIHSEDTTIATVTYSQTGSGIELKITGVAAGETVITGDMYFNPELGWDYFEFPIKVAKAGGNVCDHDHSDGWIALTQENVANYTNKFGKYYLTENIDLGGSLFSTYGDGSLMICLNGYTLTGGMYVRAMGQQETHFTLCSCQEGGKIVKNGGVAVNVEYYNYINAHDAPFTAVIDSVTVEGSGYNGIFSKAETTIRNCSVSGFETGVELYTDRKGTISDTTITGNVVGLTIIGELELDGKCIIDGNSYTDEYSGETTVQNLLLKKEKNEDGSPSITLRSSFDTVNSLIGITPGEYLPIPYTFCSSYWDHFYSDLDCYRVTNSSGSTLESRITQHPGPKNDWTIEVDTTNTVGDPVEVIRYTWKEVIEQTIEECSPVMVDDYPSDAEKGNYYIIGTETEDGIQAFDCSQYGSSNKEIRLFYLPEDSEPLQEKVLHFTVTPADALQYEDNVTKLSDTEFTAPVEYNEWTGMYCCYLSTFGTDFTLSDISIVSTVPLTETTKKLNDPGDGEYLCTVTFGDGSSVTSEPAVDIEKTAQTLSFASDSMTKTYGDAGFTNALSGASTTVTYESSNASVASVDANGKVTILKAGSTTITAAAAEDDTYASATASYTLTVNKAQNNRFTGKLICADISEGKTPSPRGAQAKYGNDKVRYLYSVDGNAPWDTWEKTDQGVGTYYVKAVVDECDDYNGAESNVTGFSERVAGSLILSISGDTSARHTDVKTYTVKLDGKRPCGTAVVWDITGGTYEYVGGHIGTDSVTIICEDVGTLHIHAALVNFCGRPVRDADGNIVEASLNVQVQAKPGNIINMITTVAKTVVKSISRLFGR